MVVMASKSRVLSDSSNGGRVGRFLADERGTTAIEYALIASGIAAAIISIVFGVGATVTNSLYNKISAAMG
jgi:pilus assembly protein Flp/PilA